MSNNYGNQFDSASLQRTLFPPNSRYHGMATLSMVNDNGEEVIYLKRRFLPHPENLDEVGHYTVGVNDRPDSIAYQQLGDPELFWRICDGNFAMNPAELVSYPGQTIRLTAPESMGGP